MSIRALAKDLYRAQQNFDRLTRAHESAAPEERQALARELKIAEKELLMLRRMLDGEKESGKFRKKFNGFGNSKR